jgi:hypothetical protein
VSNTTFRLQKAQEAIIQRAYRRALDLLRPLAESGDAEAQFLYGLLYFKDRQQTKAQSVEWLERAAEQNHAEALYVLAVGVGRGDGYTFEAPTNARSRERLEQAAEQHSLPAVADLGHYYGRGMAGFPQDAHIASQWAAWIDPADFRWLRPEAAYDLGVTLLDESNYPDDVERGVRLLGAAAHTAADINSPIALEAAKFLTTVFEEGLYGVPVDRQVAQNVWKELKPKRSRRKQMPVWEDFIQRHTRRALQYDLREASFEMFVDFLFDHHVRKQRRDTWEFFATVQHEPATLVQFYTRLFEDPTVLTDQFRRDQLEQGFWVLMGSHHGAIWTVAALVWNSDVPLKERETCIRSMFDLFAKLFADDALGEASFKWWDALARPYHREARSSFYGDKPNTSLSEGDWLRTRDVMFETLAQILRLSALNCQAAALNGLRHLNHPDTEHIIRDYLNTLTSDDPRLRQYAEAALNGNVL